MSDAVLPTVKGSAEYLEGCADALETEAAYMLTCANRLDETHKYAATLLRSYAVEIRMKAATLKRLAERTRELQSGARGRA